MSNNDGTKGILSNSEGKIIPEIEKEITFTLDKTEETPEYSRGETITVKAALTDENGTKFDCTGDMTNWKIVIICQDIQVKTSSSNIIKMETAWPPGIYQLYISAEYEGIVYSADFIIEIDISSLTFYGRK